MAYPAGVVTTQLTFGTAQAMIGQDALAMTVKVTPTTNLVYSGNVFIADTKTIQVAAGGSGAVTLINPDQAGFFNGGGLAIRNWGYTFEITYSNGSAALYTAPPKIITWFASDTGPLDVDTMVPIADGSGILVPATTVSSAIASIAALTTDTAVSPLLDTATATRGKLDARYGSGVHPEAYVQAGDNGNWSLAIARALAYATPLSKPVVLQSIYLCATTIALVSNDALVGLGPRTGLLAPNNAPMTVLTAANANGIVLDNFLVDGNCLSYSGASKARGVRFVSCTNTRVNRMTVQFIPDWGTSFEQCTNVLVTNHVHRAGQAVQNGGRDGIHFLDCTDVLLDGARIHSGDDCVGITSQTQNIARIVVRNVTGVSEIAAVVTVGNEGSTNYTASDLTFENVSTYKSPDYAGISSYIVKVRAQNTSFVRGLRIVNVTGTSNAHAVWLDGNSSTPDAISEVTLVGVRAISAQQHGIFLSYVTHFSMSSCSGVSQLAGFDGVNATSTQFGVMSGCRSHGSATWGLQLNTCTSLDIVGFISRDNGGASFSSSTGGNVKVANCNDIQFIGGQFVGSTSTSYYGSFATGTNTNVVVPASTRVGGAH